MNLVQAQNLGPSPDAENQTDNIGPRPINDGSVIDDLGPAVENLGPSPAVQNVGADIDGSVIDNSDRVENLGEDMDEDLVTKRAAYDSRSSSSQSRDRQTVREAAHNDRSAVLSTGAKMFSEEGHKAAATLVKRVNADPSIGEPLLKCLKKMEADLEPDRMTPIKALAYILGNVMFKISIKYYGIFTHFGSRKFVSPSQKDRHSQEDLIFRRNF